MSDHHLWAYRIRDILSSIERIEKTLSGLGFDAYMQSSDAQDIVARHFQVIGEASRKLPDDVTARHSDIPWSKMIGLRNFVVHEYHCVDQRIIWDTALIELPKIKRMLKKIELPAGE